MSTLLQLSHLTKSYGLNKIFTDANLVISEKQKIGVIGRNGAGKSTLFKIIVGEESADSGTIHNHAITRLGYLAQQEAFLPEEIVMGYLERVSGKPDWQCAKVAGLFQLKKELLDTKLESLSGGYQMRAKLTAMLLLEPNLILLDEPTNYLDLSTQLLLEHVLRSYNGAFLIISHDREFLKNTCEQTLEVDQGELTLYPGPLEDYLAYKEHIREEQLRYNKKVAREQRHLQRFVDRFRYKASKASQAQSKLKQLSKLHLIEIKHHLKGAQIIIPPAIEKKGLALRVENLAIGYPNKTVANNITFDIDRGEHVAILGDNGQGKTTLLKTLAGTLPALSGMFKWGHNLRFAYYAQHVPAMLDPHKTVKQHLRESGPELYEEELLAMAGNFLFKDDDLDKHISVLSGGEKARLCLAGLLLTKSNVLLLDEPTNHLDFETVEALAEALKEFNGTVFFVSHNRTFVNLLATTIIEVKDGKAVRIPGTYEEYVYYLEEKMHLLPPPPSEPLKEIPVISKQERYEELKQLKKKLRQIEESLAELERDKQKVMGEFEEHPTEYSRERYERLDWVNGEIKGKEGEWMEVTEVIQRFSLYST
jgi:ATP-binding cassette subfamily F protein 3